MLVDKLTQEERFVIVQFVLRYTVGEIPYQKAFECIDVLQKYLVIADKVEFVKNHSKAPKDLCIQLIILLGKNISDAKMKEFMKEYDDFSKSHKEPDNLKPNPDKITEQEIIEIEFTNANRAFLKKALDRSINKMNHLVKTTYPDNYTFLKQISLKCNNTSNKYILMSFRQCSTLKGYLDAEIKLTSHRRAKNMLETVNDAMINFERQNNL